MLSKFKNFIFLVIKELYLKFFLSFVDVIHTDGKAGLQEAIGHQV